MNLFNKRTNELNPYVVSNRIIDSDEDWLVLDWNESTNKIDNYIKDSLIDFVKKGELNLYGDIDCTELKKKLAEVIGVEHTCMTFFNGSDFISKFEEAQKCLTPDEIEIEIKEKKFTHSFVVTFLLCFELAIVSATLSRQLFSILSIFDNLLIFTIFCVEKNSRNQK
jgi:hypothetical protein